jgi:hypothetical protein
MSIQSFLKKENVETLWDVIIDENIFKFLSKDNQNKVYNIFIENIKGFFENDRKTASNLIDMNKKYILLILNYIKTTYSNQIPNKIKIYEEPAPKELITYEEIQNDKKSQFEKDLMKRQEEFTSAMALPIPEVPEFTDKFTDSPISEMDKMIKEITARRNYDVELINRSFQNQVISEGQTDEWLKPQETSIKNEKLNKNTINNTNRLNNLEEKEKNVTWGENQEIYFSSMQEETLDTKYETNIFNKLKKKEANQNPNQNPNPENITLNINELGLDLDLDLPDRKIEQRLSKIEESLELYKNKIDKIFDILQNRENKEK